MKHVLVVVVLTLVAATLHGAEPKPPNVLFIAVDDLRDWVGYLGGHPQAKTPNIDRLADRGVAFTRSYCQAPVCNASRAALLSGLSPATTGIYENDADWRSILDADKMLPVVFRKAGYFVAGAGKIYHGAGLNRDSDWDSYFHPVPHELKPIGVSGVAGIRFAPLDCNDSELRDYVIADWTIEQLRNSHDKPFFLACGFFKPHMPWNVPQKYFDRFPLDSIQLPPTHEDDLADVPPGGVALARSFGDHDAIQKSGRWKEAVQAYLATINYLDMNVGRVIDALDASPYRDNTIVVLWSDHGWHLGEKDHWRKFALWEQATRSPLIWVVPGVTKPHSRCDRTVDFSGVYPTLTELCGIETPPHVQGVSHVSLLVNPDAEWNHPAVMTYLPNNHAVRTERWRYIRYADGGEELYDHSTDRHEWTNLADRPDLAAVKFALMKHLPLDNAPRITGRAGRP